MMTVDGWSRGGAVSGVECTVRHGRADFFRYSLHHDWIVLDLDLVKPTFGIAHLVARGKHG